MSDIMTFTNNWSSGWRKSAVEPTLTSLPSEHGHGLRETLTPPYVRSSPLLLLHILGSSDPSSLPPTGWRRGPVAVENGRHDNGAQLRSVAVGESVSRPPSAGPRHADEGQHLYPRQLGVSAGNGHLPQPLV